MYYVPIDVPLVMDFELRVPFLDSHLVNYCTKLDGSVRRPHGDIENIIYEMLFKDIYQMKYYGEEKMDLVMVLVELKSHGIKLLKGTCRKSRKI